MEVADYFGDLMDTRRRALSSLRSAGNGNVTSRGSLGVKALSGGMIKRSECKTQESVPEHLGEGSPRTEIGGKCCDKMGDYFLQLSKQRHGNSPLGYQPNIFL